MYNFRSYELFETQLGDTGTVIVGANGTGKANLLEAVYIALRGTSFRGSLLAWMRDQAPHTIIHLETNNQPRRVQLLRSADNAITKEFTIADSTSKTLLRKHRLPVVLFAPSDLRLIWFPAQRRVHCLD